MRVEDQVFKTLPYTPFEPSEFVRRVKGAQRLMAERGLDAVLVTSEHNFRYFVGDIGTTPTQTTRPRFLVIPASGDVIAVVPRGMDEFLQQTTWLKNFRTWPGPDPRDEGVSALSAVLNEALPANARIGTELGAESRLGMPVGDFLRVRDAIGPRQFVDASDAVTTRLRMIKSPAEVQRIRTVCGLVSEAFEALPDNLGPGMTERVACRVFELDCFARGVDKTAKIACVSGAGGYARPYGAPTDKVVSEGDVLFIDAGCLFDFYWCDFNRNFAFGAADFYTSAAYETVWAATEAGIAAVKPGIPVCDVWSAMSDVFGRASGGGRATSIGRMGHSMGLWMPELPSIQPDDETVLQPGMILNIEPSTSYMSSSDVLPRLMLHEEVVVVTQNGAELLTLRAPPSIPVIA